MVANPAGLHRWFKAFTLTLLTVSLAAIALAACGSDTDATTDGAPSEVSPVTTLTNADGWPRVEGLRGDRYCEVLLVSAVNGRLNAQVWNTYTLNDCPEDAWRALDSAVIKEERGVLFALLNGPRYWLMDAIEKKPAGSREETTFGSLRMFLAATIDLGPIPPDFAPYTERHVARETVFEFAKGSEVYELTDRAARVFVMQSYSAQSDTSFTDTDLAGLGGRIMPPAGWVFSARTLDTDLRVLSIDSDAVVIQDELGNTYQLIESE
jgi:hypothetical protein